MSEKKHKRSRSNNDGSISTGLPSWMKDSGNNQSTNKRRDAPVYTSLMKAAAQGDEETVTYLLELSGGSKERKVLSRQGAAEDFGDDLEFEEEPVDLFTKDRKGRTALDWARLGRHSACAELLENAMAAEIESKRKANEKRAERTRLQGMISRNAAARTALLAAIDDHRNQDVAALLESTSKTRDGVPPITRHDFDAASKLLLKRSERKKEIFWLDVESVINGTAIMMACTCGDLPLLKKLLEPQHGLKLDKETDRGHTALTWCCVCGNLDAVSLLLDAGAAVTSVVKKSGRTTLHMAASTGSAPVIQVLLDRVLRMAIEGRYDTAMDTVKVTAQEKDAKERTWMRPFERFTQCRDKYRNQTALEIAMSVDPTGEGEAVKLLQAANERIARREWEIKQMDLKGEMVDCIQGCGFRDRADKIEHHEINECPKRIVGCDLCGQQLPLQQLEAHDELQCPNRLLLCCNIGRGCTESVRAERLDVHERRLCRYRDVVCRVPCDAVMEFRFRDEHEQEKCPNRSVMCPSGCGVYVRAFDCRTHVEQECAMRLVSCRVGCGLDNIPFKERESHEQEVCIQPCRWEGCTRRVGPLETRTIHENFLCPRRVVACPLGCGIVGMVAAHRDQHASKLCELRVVSCPQGCGSNLLASEVEMHLDPDNGTCEERLRRCPFDIVRTNGREGRRIEVETSPGQFVVCSIRAYSRANDCFKLIYPDTVKWERLKDLSYKFIDKTWVCGWVPFDGSDLHMDEECSLRTSSCPQNCGQVLNIAKMPLHLEACPKRIAACPLGCGKSMEARLLEGHTEKECDCREIRCSKCGVYGVKEREMHQHWKHHCSMLEVRCGFGCGVPVPRKELAHHMSNVCGKRPATCEECGLSEDLWIDEMPRHLRDDCPMRLVECRFGCKEVMRHAYLVTHENEMCDRRLAPCENCGMLMKQKEIADHKVLDCPGFLRFCPAGCGAKVRTIDLKQHQRDECGMRHAGAGGLIICPLGCGKELPYAEQFKHITMNCVRRILDCPWGCDEMMAANLQEDHKLVCPRRKITCGFGCPACARELRSWSTPTVELTRGRLLAKIVQLDALIEIQVKKVDEASEFLSSCLEPEEPPYRKKLEEALKEQQKLETEKQQVENQKQQLDIDLVNQEPYTRKVQLVRCSTHESTALLRACANGEPGLVAQLVQLMRSSGASKEEIAAELHRPQVDGHNAMTKACQVGDLNMVRLLVREGADINNETINGRTALVECAKHGRVDVAKYLIEEGAVLEMVTKQKTTAFDWALNSGQAKVLRHMVREYRVQKDLLLLFRLINMGDLKAVRELIKAGDAYQLHHQNIIEREIQECDEEVAETEASIAFLKLDLVQKERQLEDYLREQATELAKVKGYQDEADQFENDGNRIVAQMLEKYDRAMLYLQQRTQTDISEVTGVKNYRDAPPKARLILKAMCIMMDATPGSSQDMRLVRYGAANALQHGLESRGDGKVEEEEDRLWWTAARKFFQNTNCLNKLRFFNKRSLTEETERRVKALTKGKHALKDFVWDDKDLAGLNEGNDDGYDVYDGHDVLKLGDESESDDDGYEVYDGYEVFSDLNQYDDDYEVNAKEVEEDNRPWKLIDAVSKWIVAVMSYKSAARENERLHNQENFVRKQYEESLPGLELAQYHVRIAKFGYGLVKRELDEQTIHVAYLNKKIAGCEERIRVAKIFQCVSSCGHSITSWAAAVNQPDILELMFDHGAAPGYCDEVYILCATVIQLQWRNHHWLKHRGPFAPSLSMPWREKALKHQISMKDALSKLHHFRCKNRLPLVEAMYNGHHRIIDVFRRKNIPMIHASRSWSAPLPMIPFTCPPPPPALLDTPMLTPSNPKAIENGDMDLEDGEETVRSHDSTESSTDQEEENLALKEFPKIGGPAAIVDMLSACLKGYKERACDDFVARKGWVEHTDEDSNWSIALRKAIKAWDDIYRIVDEGNKEKARRKRVRIAAKEQAEMEAELEDLLTAGVMDWEAIVSLIVRGAPCDYESKEGFTPLLRAAEEDTEGLYYKPCINADKQPVLAIELLLDRQLKRPKIELETRLGHTALSWAALKDRQSQMEALIKRGADVNFVSKKHHRTALIWAAMCGKHRSVRFLLEINADQEVRDNTGKRAVEWAKQNRHQEALTVLLQFRQGNLGIPVAKRGAAIEKVPCCWGCGLLADRAFLAAGHEANECPRRIVQCRNVGCKVELLQAWEQEQHETELCVERSIDCPLGCGSRLRRTEMAPHIDSMCVMRTVDCELGCGLTMRARDREFHEREECLHRLVGCKLMCHTDVRARDLDDHIRNRCPERSVRCRMGCGLTMMARLRDGHEEDACDSRLMTCPNKCKCEVRAKDLEVHQKDSCPKRKVPCPNKCKVGKVQFRILEQHLANTCGKRFVKCPDKCGKAIRFEDLPVHISDECPRRQVDCPLGCGVPMMEARVVELHCRNECERRIIVCSLCGDGVEQEKLNMHKERACMMRIVECGHRGCYKRCTVTDLPHHENFECRKRQVMCLQGCGMSMFADKRKGHHDTACPMRFVPCPLGCPKPIRENEKQAHIKSDCVRRQGQS